VQHFVGPEQQTVPFEEVLSTSSGLQRHVPPAMHSVLLAQQAHFSTFPHSIVDVTALSEEEASARGAEHAWEQSPLQLSDIAVLLEEEIMAGGAEHV